MQLNLPLIGLTTILGILSLLFLILLINLCTFYRLPSNTHKRNTIKSNVIHGKQYNHTLNPLLSVLVPARNEEKSIEACVRSLVAQEYERLEVLVLDDQSSDATAQIVEHILAELPATQQERLRLLHGEDVLPGWIGKNFACDQLAKKAIGDYLLFTDADTIHKPDMARTVINCMQRLDVALLTAQPEHLMESLGERLVVPLLNFTILTLLPVALIPRRREPSLATGNGQLLCFKRAGYEQIGGHASVKGRILEDVLLARAIKVAGLRMVFVDAQEMVSCRMYHSFKEVWAGFSKNLFAFYNYSIPFALLALLLNLALFVIPPMLVLIALFVTVPPMILSIALIAFMITLAMRILLTLRFTHTHMGKMLLLCLLHPLSILIECLILLNSIRWHYSKAGTLWKGRYYLL